MSRVGFFGYLDSWLAKDHAGQRLMIGSKENATRNAARARFDSRGIGGRVVSSLRGFARSITTRGHELDVDLASSATVNAQFWLNRFPLRPTAGWVVVAALLSLGVVGESIAVDWKTLTLLWLLVDPMWGSIWRLAGGRVEVLPLHERDDDESVWLPYIEEGSPAHLLFGRNSHDVLQLVFRVALPGVLLAFAVAFVLGGDAVWLTLALLVISVLGWLSRHTWGVVPASMHSVVTIVLPWWLTLTQLGAAGQDGSQRLLMLVIAAWFLHNWGESRALRIRDDRLGALLMVVADIGIALTIVILKAPIWLALLVVLWLPSWFAIVQRRPMKRQNFWWLLAMLASAAAVGQSVVQ